MTNITPRRSRWRAMDTSRRVHGGRSSGLTVVAAIALLALAACGRTLPTESNGPQAASTQEPGPAGTPAPGAQPTSVTATYKGFVSPQCTYTAAYWFDNFPQSKAGFPVPGQNWRGNACAWDVNAYAAGWAVWWGSPNVGSVAVQLRLAGAILVWDAVPNNAAGHVGVIMSCNANGATVRESNWPLGSGQVDHILSWPTIFNRNGYRLKGFILRERR